MEFSHGFSELFALKLLIRGVIDPESSLDYSLGGPEDSSSMIPYIDYYHMYHGM